MFSSEENSLFYNKNNLTKPQYYATENDFQVVLREVYRQIFGNCYVVRNDSLINAESLLRNRDVSIRDFIRLVAKTDIYRSLFFESCPQYRFIELNYKHFLGRAPQDQSEIAYHTTIYNNQGYEADIDSYLNSDEYIENFGDSIIPYNRKHTMAGIKNVCFNRTLSLFQGNATSDKSNKAILISDLAANLPTKNNAFTSGSSTPGNSNKRFRISVTNAGIGAKYRRSNSTYQVSYSQLSRKIQGIHKMGGRILNVTEVPNSGFYAQKSILPATTSIAKTADSYRKSNRLDSEIKKKTRTSNDIKKSTESGTFQSLVRYPNLTCPDKVNLNATFVLGVELLLEAPKDQRDIEEMKVLDPDASKLPELEVELVTYGFDVEDGVNFKKIKVKRDQPTKIRFKLTSRTLGEQAIKVEFYQYDKLICSTKRNILVTGQEVYTTVLQPDQSPLILGSGSKPTIPIQQLDLIIDFDRNANNLYFRLHSKKAGYNHEKIGTVELYDSTPQQTIEDLYKELRKMARKIPLAQVDRTNAENRLAALGRELWDRLIPKELQEQYWIFKSKVQSVLITSDEPWIPWEMMKPYRHAKDGYEEDPFWCQQFSISRWLSTAGPPTEIPVGKTRIIAPAIDDLKAVKDEISLVDQLSVLHPAIISMANLSTKLQVVDCINKEDLALYHFACHGKFRSESFNNSIIELADGCLYPSDIHPDFGVKSRPRPLIFMNACDGARNEYFLTGLGGWAEKFVTAQVGAFIGAMWEVSDDLALEFAQAFYYNYFHNKKPIAEAFRLAREEIRKKEPYNSSWLAYTLYADPESVVK